MGSAIEFRPGNKPRLLYALSQDFWHASEPEPDGFWRRHFEVSIMSPEAVEKRINAVDEKTRVIGRPNNGAAEMLDQRARKFISWLDFDRARKTAYEVECIAAANRIAARGHGVIASMFNQDKTELDLHLAYCSACQQTESELPYPNIIAANEHAAILHYQNRDRQLVTENRSLLIDAGASYAGYAADVTRTYGNSNQDFIALIGAMNELQQDICLAATHGTEFIALNELTHQRLGKILAESGLVHCSADTAYGSGLTSQFLPHGLGHLLGLQVHDVGGQMRNHDGDMIERPEQRPFLRLTRALECGFVVTIEPGLYFIPSLLADLDRANGKMINWALVDELRAHGGIRIEDNVLVESTTVRNLTREAFAAAPAVARH